MSSVPATPRTIVAADAQPYYAGSGPVGVLLIHGFTGTPGSMVEWAQHLEGEGFRVAVPRLPGHGTSWQELNATGWQDWYGTAEREFDQLRSQCQQVFVCGLSMGGCLALRLAEQRGDQVGALALVNPVVTITDARLFFLPILRMVQSSVAGIASDIAQPHSEEPAYDRTPLHALHSQRKMWREVRDKLPAVDQPLLLFRSVTDHVVDPASGRIIVDKVSSTDIRERLLTRSYHVATMDYERAEIFAETAQFFHRLSRGS